MPIRDSVLSVFHRSRDFHRGLRRLLYSTSLSQEGNVYHAPFHLDAAGMARYLP